MLEKTIPRVYYVVVAEKGGLVPQLFPSRRTARDWAYENVTSGYKVRRATLKLFES